nr:response regulator [Anaerolineae bacterium]
MTTTSTDPKDWIILIVEDEPDNLDVSRTVLEFHGATVHTAVDGREGLILLETITPTLILLDLSMPHMDGWEMLKLIRGNPRTEPIPVVAVTAHAMSGDKERVMEAGFNGYIAKPFKFGTFLAEIKHALEAAGAGQPDDTTQAKDDRDGD